MANMTRNTVLKSLNLWAEYGNGLSDIACWKVSSMNPRFNNKYRRFHCSNRTSDSVTCARGAKYETTVGEALKRWRSLFQRQEIPEADESIRNIIAHVLNTRKLSDVRRLKNKYLTSEEIQQIENLCRKRLERNIFRMPIQYIIGEWDFRDLNLKMRPPVFIPRPETEMLVDLVIEEIRLKRAKKVLELCCGSGAISLALLSEFPDLEVTAVDKSREACALTKENAQRLGLERRLSLHQYEMNGEDRMDFVKDGVDVVVSNPPYVPSDAMNELQQEIKLYEDLQALDGGDDGLTIIKHVLKISSDILQSGSLLFLEVDPSHPEKLRELLCRNTYPNLVYLRTHKDFCGKSRFVEIIKKGNISC